MVQTVLKAQTVPKFLRPDGANGADGADEVEDLTQATQVTEKDMIDVKDLTQVTQAPELGTRTNEDSNDALLRQVDEELARLTTPEAHYALNAHVQETLEDVELLTLQEPLDSSKRKEWIKGMREELTILRLKN